MAINKESNVYTIVFATIMVVIVGGVLAFLATFLKPIQQANIINEKKQNILQATGFMDKSSVTRESAGKDFDTYVTRRITIDFQGNIISDKKSADKIDGADDAFNIDMRKEFMTVKDKKARKYPIFVCEKGGETVYVLSCSGKGLWDDVWGYVGLSSDGKTIKCTIFDHKAETPGLGSVIAEAKFQDGFVGKKIADESGTYKPIMIMKPGLPLDTDQKVDGLSGATFTAKGVDEMMSRNFEVYYNFFQKNAAEFIK
jgi:Na+-transporting NADH:ubiquinone oxidoreductase subunit C